MAKSVDEQVAALRANPTVDELRKALRGKRGYLIAVAAKLVAEQRLDALADELGAAFTMLVGDDATKRDPGCRGKQAIARALLELETWDERVFVAGLHVVQIEGFDPEDTAAPLRGLCGVAHAQLARPNALDVLAELLVDTWRNARIAAARGLGDSGRIDASALLRFKLLIGDDEPEVLAQCFESMFALAPEGAGEFARASLAREALAEAAALALGSHRVASAVDALAAWCERCKAEQRRRIGYVALALLRCDAGNAILSTRSARARTTTPSRRRRRSRRFATTRP